MEPQHSSEILHDFSPRFLVYKDGRVQRLRADVSVPPSYDPKTRVHSKDAVISNEVSVRIYMPDNIPKDTKLPLLIYYHGGAFCQFSSTSKMYHDYLNSLVSEANVIAVSVDYRLAPEFPISACYEDSWVAIQWVCSHSTGSGTDQWLNQWADFGKVLLAGDSAGANIAHHMVAQAHSSGLLSPPSRLVGLVLVHVYFHLGGELPELLKYLCMGKLDETDRRLNPLADSTRMREELECERVLVCVDEEDILKGIGVKYYETLKGSEWKGDAQLVVTNGGGHVFHLFSPEDEKAKEFLEVVASFIKCGVGSRM